MSDHKSHETKIFFFSSLRKFIRFSNNGLQCFLTNHFAMFQCDCVKSPQNVKQIFIEKKKKLKRAHAKYS